VSTKAELVGDTRWRAADGSIALMGRAAGQAPTVPSQVRAGSEVRRRLMNRSARIHWVLPIQLSDYPGWYPSQ
jgi:hypothetical protein